MPEISDFNSKALYLNQNKAGPFLCPIISYQPLPESQDDFWKLFTTNCSQQTCETIEEITALAEKIVPMFLKGCKGYAKSPEAD